MYSKLRKFEQHAVSSLIIGADQIQVGILSLHKSTPMITNGPSVYFEMDRGTVVVTSDSTEITIMMEHALYIDSLRSKR